RRASWYRCVGTRQTFSMAMNQLGLHYRSHNQVVEYEPGRLITWQTTGRWHDINIVGGQRWRFELIPSAHRTLVRHSYLWGDRPVGVNYGMATRIPTANGAHDAPYAGAA